MLIVWVGKKIFQLFPKLQHQNFVMHNVTADQIEKNKQLITLVKGFPQIYNHDPAMSQQNSGDSVEEIWAKIGQELQETRKLKVLIMLNALLTKFLFITSGFL